MAPGGTASAPAFNRKDLAVNDFWHRWVVDIGLTGPDKGEGGRYLLLPPGYDSEVPDGYIVVRPRTYANFLGYRGFRDESGDPHPAVEVIKGKDQGLCAGPGRRPTADAIRQRLPGADGRRTTR